MKLSTDYVLSTIKTIVRCDKRKPFSVDDARKRIEKNGVEFHQNAWGMCFYNLYRDGKIKPVRMVRTARKTSHGRRVVEWRLA